MAAEDALYTALSGASAVTAVVGDKIYSDVPDQGDDPPLIFYERISTEMIHTIHNGVPIAEFAVMSVVCYATTREAAESLGDKVVTATTNADFIYSDRGFEYDPETRLFAAAIELQHNQTN